MNKSEALKKARKLAKKIKDNIYVIQDEPPFSCAILTQSQYDDYPTGWLHLNDVVAIYDEFGRCA